MHHVSKDGLAVTRALVFGNSKLGEDKTELGTSCLLQLHIGLTVEFRQ